MIEFILPQETPAMTAFGDRLFTQRYQRDKEKVYKPLVNRYRLRANLIAIAAFHAFSPMGARLFFRKSEYAEKEHKPFDTCFSKLGRNP